jgi:hypothetical protein
MEVDKAAVPRYRFEAQDLALKQVLYSSKVGGPTYTRTTAHGTTAANLVFVMGQVATRPGVALADAGEMGSIEEQTARSWRTSRPYWKRLARLSIMS